MSRLTALSARTGVDALVAFADLTRFMVNSRRHGDAAMAEVLDTLYRRAAAHVETDRRRARQADRRRRAGRLRR